MTDASVTLPTAASVVARARTQLGHAVMYVLGHGGMDPAAPHPFDADNKCDCTGFLPWCLGVSRRTDNEWYKAVSGGWMNADSIFRDCADPQGEFDGVEWEKAEPGMVLVMSAVPHGHVGLVTEVDATGPSRVIHCSHGNWLHTGDAIRETDVNVFKAAGARVARFAGVNYG